MQSRQTNLQLDSSRIDTPRDTESLATGDNKGRHASAGSTRRDARQSRVRGSTHGPSKPWQRGLFRQVLKSLGNPAVAVRLWDGYRLEPRVDSDPGSSYDATPVGTVTVTSPEAYNNLLRFREVGFGDGYRDGSLLIDGDLVDVLVEIERAKQRVLRKPNVSHRVFETMAGVSTRKPLKNTLSGSLDNIGHHYNIGNDFYQMWLDTEAMQYTCAYYAHDAMTLEQAQLAKCEHVCRKLQLKPGDAVVEAGSGWGGLARFMASHYDVEVKAYNISQEQVRFATRRARELGLDDRIEYIEDDYRNITGSFDKFVSIGMLEHVGTANYRELGEVIDGCLRDDGRGLIHTIGRNRPRLMNAWIEKRIFPGAYPPTLAEMMEIFEGPGFSVTDVENLRLHYAHTLRDWLVRYDAREPEVAEMFDDSFVRAWRLYLAGSIAAFETSSLQLFQVAFARGTDNGVSPTREHLYESAEYPQTGVRRQAS